MCRLTDKNGYGTTWQHIFRRDAVRNISTIRNIAWSLKRTWRAWQTRLRRNYSALTLSVLLTLGLGEPLLCVFHCQVWLPLIHHAYFSAQHQHQHQSHIIQNSAMATAPGVPALQATDNAQPAYQALLSIGIGGAATTTNCFSMQPGSSAPAPSEVPPSPVHDLLILMVAFVLVIPRLIPYHMKPPNHHASITPPLFLRPPITSAA